MLHRFICTAVLLAVLGFCAFAAQEPTVSARSAVLMAADTGEVLFAKNEHERLGMASTTKIMTALLTIEQATPNRLVTATPESVRVEGTAMGLKAGDRVSFHDLAVGMLLPSGNDAANTAALSIAGSLHGFADLMNQKAQDLGMTNTHFVTPSGLDDEDHYSTAYDMALLASYAVRNPHFVQICSAQTASVHLANEAFSRTYHNHNRLLRSLPGAFGVKTGFTKKSGRCLVSAVRRSGITLVCVTLCDPNDWQDHEMLYDYGFSLVRRASFSPPAVSVRVFGAGVSRVAVHAAQELSVPTASGTVPYQLRVMLKPYCFAPVKQGQVLGTAAVYDRERCVASTALVAETAVPSVTKEIRKDGLFQRMIRRFRKGHDPARGSVSLCLTTKSDYKNSWRTAALPRAENAKR